MRIDMHANFTSLRRKLGQTLLAYKSDQSGATAIEYGLIAALIGIGLIGGLKLLGGGTNGMWTKISNAVGNELN